MSQRALPRPRARLPRRAAPRRACSSAAARRPIAPSLDVKLRSPSGRVTTRSFRLPRQRCEASAGCSSRCRCPRPQLWSPDAPQLYAAEFTPARARAGGAARTPPDRAALRRGEAGAPVAQQPPHPAARRVDPRGHARLGRRPHRRGHGPHRRRPEGPGRERHARALPAERPAAVPLRPRGHPGLEPGADLAARPAARGCSGRPRSASERCSPCAARSPPRAATLGAHALGRQRAHLHAGPAARHAALPARGAGPGARHRPDAADLASTSRAAPASPSSSPTTRST